MQVDLRLLNDEELDQIITLLEEKKSPYLADATAYRLDRAIHNFRERCLAHNWNQVVESPVA